MANLKISQLPAASTPLAGSEEVPVVQSGVTEKVTVGNLTAGRAVNAASLTTTGAVAVGAGSVSAPSVTTSGDLDSGVCFPSAGAVAIASNGAQALLASGNTVTIGDANTARLTAQNGSGTNDLAAALIISPGSSTGAAQPAKIDFETTDAGVSGSTVQTRKTRMTIGESDSATLGTVIVGSTIDALDGLIRAADGSGTDSAGFDLFLAGGQGRGAGVPGNLLLQTSTAGASSAVRQNLVTRALVNGSGEIIAGNGDAVASPAASTIRGTNGSGTNVAGANLTIQGGLGTGSGAGGYIRFQTSAAGASGSTLRTATEAARIDSAQRLLVGITSANANGGVLQLKSGITFPATAVASSDANTLDDYEEGTWTPVVEGATTAGTYVLTTAVGRYTKIGRLVYVMADIAVDTTGNTAGTGSLEISGLPFTSASGATFVGNGNIDSSATAFIAAYPYISGSSTSVLWRHRVSSTTSATQTPVTFVSTTAGTVLRFSCLYNV